MGGHNKSLSLAPQHNDFEFEFDESYFRQFYKPLSNLPTPPLSTHNPSAPQSPRIGSEDAESLNSHFLGPAAHLARMLPPGASFITPSIATLQQMLARADLPMDIIALAVCILDSLDSKFSRNWRVAYPVNRLGQSMSKRHSLPCGPGQAGSINSVPPEVIILSALMIADKFVQDLQRPTQFFRTAWGDEIWTCDQINFTERCIMESLNYRILPLWDPSIINQARHDIEMARREIIQENICTITVDGGCASEDKKHVKSMSSGHAVLGLGVQLTPAVTPSTEPTTIFG
ncbi:hypothetical protein F5Y16DRAFT_135456 [Xylariaceae sp. FL0255]|nr:hypothetical protein F5Y16DRAFT_135456 [Xylariaceae sp. FL0255]